MALEDSPKINGGVLEGFTIDTRRDVTIGADGRPLWNGKYRAISVYLPNFIPTVIVLNELDQWGAVLLSTGDTLIVSLKTLALLKKCLDEIYTDKPLEINSNLQ